MVLLRTLHNQWNIYWRGISEMLELSAVISPQSDNPKHLILFRVTSHCGFFWQLFSASFTNLAELKILILNGTPETLRSVEDHAVSRFQFVVVSGRLKMNVFVALYVAFGLRIINNRFFPPDLIRTCYSGWAYRTKSQLLNAIPVQLYTLNSTVGLMYNSQHSYRIAILNHL